MSIWNTIADIAGVGLAPFTGGASLSLIPVANQVINGIQGDGTSSPGTPNTLAGAASGAQGAQNTLNDELNKYDANQIAEYNAELAAKKQNNDIAVENPAKFTGQSVLASILQGNGRVGGSAVNPNAAALGALTTLQGQDATNLADSPTKNPVPSADSVVAPTLNKPTGSTLANVLGTGSLLSQILNSGGGNANGGAAGLPANFNQLFSGTNGVPSLNVGDLPPGTMLGPGGYQLPTGMLDPTNLGTDFSGLGDVSYDY